MKKLVVVNPTITSYKTTKSFFYGWKGELLGDNNTKLNSIELLQFQGPVIVHIDSL